METYINGCQDNKKQNLVVSRKRNFRTSEKMFAPKTLANRMLLQAEFGEGKQAHVTYKDGKIIIKVKK